MAQIAARAKENGEGALNGADLLGVHPGAAQPDAVDAAHRVGEVHDAVRWNVATATRQTAQQGEAADAYILVHDAVAGHENQIVDVDVSAERGPRGQDDAIAELAIVPDVRL